MAVNVDFEKACVRLYRPELGPVYKFPTEGLLLKTIF
jgi:hypothetical protein